MRERGRGPGVVALGTVLTGMLMSGCPCAFALNPALDVSQYSHSAWKIRDGFFKGAIHSIAQTPDGYLWLGTEFGLLRFDGVRAVPWQPPPDQHLHSSEIYSLLAARDGTLWIGTSKGLASWKGGRFTQYAELAGQYVNALLEDHEGSVWAGVLAIPTGKLCAIQNGRVQCYGEDGSLGHGILGLYEDSKGNLWAGLVNGLWRWKPGPPKFYPLPGELDAIQSFCEGDGGALFITARSGIRRLVDEKAEAYSVPGTLGKVRAHRLLRDHEGGLWIGTLGQGLVHVHQGRTDVFVQSDGLSGDSVYRLFEDREGNIWAATNGGLDRFRDFAVPTFSVNQGLSNAGVGSVLADRDGSVWLGTGEGLNRWNHGQITVYRERGNRLLTRAAQQGVLREIVGSGLPDHGVESLFQDDRGRVWVSTVGGFGYLENDRFISISGVPGIAVHSIAEDTGESLWIANQNRGLFRLSPRSEVQELPWAKLGRKDFAMALAADHLQGGLWLGFSRGGVAYFKDGQVGASYAPGDGLGEGSVNGLRLDPDGTLWAATEGGLSRLKNSRVSTLSSKNGLPCDSVHWAMEDEDHSFWLYMPCGLVRIARSEMDAWAADPSHTINATVFDSSDGVGSRAFAGGYTPHAAKSRDGELWFAGLDGVGVIDPRHIPFNKLPPPVRIEQITADRKPYDLSGGVRLPPLIRDLRIDYTALSFVAPEKVKFRYKLEGHDTDWQDAGTRRQAFYTNLPPRSYRFHVMACNNSSVWNEAGAFLDFSVAPAYYQTTLFRLSCAAAFLALLGALYKLRLRQVAQRLNVRMEERVNERTRIARDLHDTLLQSFQGVLMKFSAVGYMIPERPDAQKTLEGVIAQARQAITEGRDAVQGLRSSTVITNDLARAITTVGEELCADQAGQNPPDFRVHVEGASRDLAPLVRGEVYRIASEAVRNACRHAQAKRIEVEIHYDPRQLRLRVRDNGKGIDPKVLSEGGRAGHHGLPGMHERAKLVGGKLTVWSELGSGTEAELTVPAAVAYAKSPAAQRSMSSGEGT
jgi:signal transduction histidine kinase/ligand-binding sensor domain-containing protein